MSDIKIRKNIKVLDTVKTSKISVQEINNIRDYVSDILENKELKLKNKKNEYSFISVNKEINEEEFLKIVNAGKRCIHKNAGLYQESLYGKYIEAKKEKDEGYIKDIFEKAIIYRENLNEIKQLHSNNRFMKEWRKNFGKITPESILKRTGKMNYINLIKNSI